MTVRVTAFAGYYLPGTRAGGPIRSVSNLVRALGDELEFSILTRHHDFGDATPYAGIEPFCWVDSANARVKYLAPGLRSFLEVIRAALGRLLFSGEDIKKSVNVISGGEQGRMLFGKIVLQRPNIILMDEPTNHLDMESIESLNLALENYEGTLIFVSHDREFVSSLATRIIEITPTGIVDYHGTYEEYLTSQGVV